MRFVRVDWRMARFSGFAGVSGRGRGGTGDQKRGWWWRKWRFLGGGNGVIWQNAREYIALFGNSGFLEDGVL